MENKLDWKKLKDAKCPKCLNVFLDLSSTDNMIKCTNTKCDFKITNERFKEIIEDLYHPGRRQARDAAETNDNFRKLQNMEYEPDENDRPEGDDSIMY